MRRKITALAVLLFAGRLTAFAGSDEIVRVADAEIVNGYIVKKVWLEQYALPTVQILEPQYRQVSGVPATAATRELGIVMGMEKKRPFALVKIPVYKADGQQMTQLEGFTLHVEEAPASALKGGVKAKTTAANSVLANGTWYKIAIGQRGVYKVDYNFLTSKLGLTGTINSANIRLYGNGGTMLSEANSVSRADDLVENAIKMEDGGDGVLGPGDYFLFYANGPMAWDKDSARRQFVHRKNLYEDRSYYFINVDQGTGRRIAPAPVAGTPTVTVADFNDYHVVEDDKVSVGKFGKQWWGDEFSNLSSQALNRTYNFDLGQLTDSVRLRVMVGAKYATSTPSFNVSLNGQSLGNLYIGFVGTADEYPIVSRTGEYTLPLNASTASVALSFTPTLSDGKGFLNYIELNTRRALSFPGGQLCFRDWKSVAPGAVAAYQLQNAGSGVVVWDITDPLEPRQVNGNLSGGTYVFASEASRLHEFVAFDGSAFAAPDFVSVVPNQNLHALPQTDYVIVVDPAFKSAANRLADYHRQKNSLRVLVVTPQEIYNEFSSGGQDISAIRDFVKMFYDRAGSNTAEMPKHLLLFGDASIDYKNRLPDNTNFVPTFESKESEYVLDGYTNDDFFGFLDDNEDIENYSIHNTLDLGVGRLPVKKAGEADDVVNKIFNYKSPASLGPWRLSNTYVADNEDGAGDHLGDAEDYAFKTVDGVSNQYASTKVYLDNMPFVSTPGGPRCPDANKIINDQVYKGNFMINYSGHGNIYTLADERILTADDFNNWKNYNALPIVVTATCDFSQFDRPDFVSAGEKMILKNNGGTIAMLTTTQAVYSSGSKIINQSFVKNQFKKNSAGRWRSFGEAFMDGKNETYAVVTDKQTLLNFRKFTLLGDPALLPNFPEHKVETDSVIQADGNLPTDTMKALGEYMIKGKVTDANGNFLSQFNGRLYVTIYDKPRLVSLRTKNSGYLHEYNVQDNIIYKGKATVVDGRFSFNFIVPKDINYEMGKGKISYYVENGDTDGAGVDTSVSVGGFSDNPVVDNAPPVIRPFMNDSLFRDGGLTGTNTLLFAILEDETGINTAGSGVGHDITGVLDGNVQSPYILNDYYETAPNNYRRGYIHFPLTGLSDGLHSLKVKAWDVNNNSGEGTVHFEVANGKVTRIRKLMNYPNPFSNLTHFVFEHNHPEELLKVQINIYSSSGVLVRSLVQPFTPMGSRTNEITWDGTDNNGAKLPSGVYVYRLILSTEKGSEDTAYEKLVLIR